MKNDEENILAISFGIVIGLLITILMKLNGVL